MDDITNICQTCLSTDRQLISTSRIRRILRKIKYKKLQNIDTICWECHSIIKKFYLFCMQAKAAQITLGKKLQDNKTLSKLIHTTKNEYDYEFIYYEPIIYISIDKTSEPKMIKKEMFEDVEMPVFDHSDSDGEYKINNVVASLKNESGNVPTLTKRPLDIKIEMSKENTFLDKDVSNKKRSLNSKLEVLKKKKSLNNKVQLLKKKRSLDSKESSKKKKPLKQNKRTIEDDKVAKKFKRIVLTEEEMLRSREEKINQPNYKKIPFKCNTCVLGFTTKVNYDLHFEKKHNEEIGNHLCPVCASRFTTEPSLNRHRSKHYLHYVCCLCGYKTYTSKAIENHCRDKHHDDDVDNIHCKQCTAVLRTSSELEQHVQTVHTLYCHDCGEKFKGKHTLRSHQVRIHAVKREFVCDMCTRSFLTKSRLESHVTKHSQTLARKLAYCSLCRVQYKNIHVYRNHVKNSANHARNRYQCPECSKKFASKVYWKKHYNFYHLKKSQYKCEDCNKLFISEWRLKNHRQIHHGLSRSREHGCTDCDKKFYTLSTLRGHQLTHSSARQFMCHRCGDTFRQRSALYTHARLLHKLK